jgi:hypothetical protein
MEVFVVGNSKVPLSLELGGNPSPVMVTDAVRLTEVQFPHPIVSHLERHVTSKNDIGSDREFLMDDIWREDVTNFSTSEMHHKKSVELSPGYLHT